MVAETARLLSKKKNMFGYFAKIFRKISSYSSYSGKKRKNIFKPAMFGLVFVLFVLILFTATKFFLASSNAPQLSDAQLEAMLEYWSIEERDILLAHPPASSPRQEHQAYYDRLLGIAQEGEVIDINKCIAATPSVLRVGIGETVTFRNEDGVSHSIAYNPEYVFTIPAGGTLEIPADFGTGSGGLYGYGCDNSKNIIGVLILSSLAEPDSENNDE